MRRFCASSYTPFHGTTENLKINIYLSASHHDS